MGQLIFTRNDDVWEATFEVTNDYNVHLEKGVGVVTFKQTTVQGATPAVNPSLHIKEYEAVMDTDVVGLVYPKWITIEARTEEAPTAFVTIKSQ